METQKHLRWIILLLCVLDVYYCTANVIGRLEKSGHDNDRFEKHGNSGKAPTKSFVWKLPNDLDYEKLFGLHKKNVGDQPLTREPATLTPRTVHGTRTSEEIEKSTHHRHRHHGHKHVPGNEFKLPPGEGNVWMTPDSVTPGNAFRLPPNVSNIAAKTPSTSAPFVASPSISDAKKTNKSINEMENNTWMLPPNVGVRNTSGSSAEGKNGSFILANSVISPETTVKTTVKMQELETANHDGMSNTKPGTVSSHVKDFASIIQPVVRTMLALLFSSWFMAYILGT